MSNNYLDIVKTFNDGNIDNSHLKIIIVGTDELGIDICKNLVCNGMKNIFLSNDDIIKDSSNSIFLNEKSIDLVSSNHLLELNELNKDTKIISIRGDLDEDLVNDSIVILVNRSIDTICTYNNVCRKLNSKMISVNSSGVSGFVFVDVNNHIIKRKGNENIDTVVIGNISDDGIVTCPSNYYHNFKSGDRILFSNLEGEDIEFLNKLWDVEVFSTDQGINHEYFKLIDFPEDHKFIFKNGYCNLNIKETEIHHKSFIDILNENNNDNLINIYKMIEDVELKPWDENTEEFINNSDEESKKIIRSFNVDIPSIRNLFSSVVSMEVLKILYNLYEPINQIFKFSDTSLISKEVPENLTLTKYGSLFGNNFDKKMSELNILIIGSGSVCTELLKVLSEYFIYTCVKIFICDNGKVSNVNIKRNFIFKENDIGKFKSAVMARKFVEYNKFIDIDYILENFSDNNDFDKILDKSNMVINTVNDLNLKNLLGEKCFDNNLPFFTVDFNKLKVTSLCSIPCKTNEFESIKERVREISFLECHKEYPTLWKHCLHYAGIKSLFFKRLCDNNNRWVSDKNFYEKLSTNDKQEAKKDILVFRHNYKFNNWKDCAFYAADYFCEEFINSIKNRLLILPFDKKLDSGKFFWSGGKKCPSIINFDIKDIYIIEFIFIMTKILSKCLCINEKFNMDDISRFLLNYRVKEFKKYDSDEEEIEIPDNLNDTLEFNYSDDYKEEILLFIRAYANLRSLNYNIKPINVLEASSLVRRLEISNNGVSEIDYDNIKTIDTISTGVSLLSLEIVKYLLDYENNNYNKVSINFENNKTSIDKMKDVELFELNSHKISKWDKFEYTKNSTLKELIEFYDKEKGYGTITFISWGSQCLYGFTEENLDKKLYDIFIKKDINLYEKSEFIDLCFDDDDDDYDFNNINEDEEEDKCIRVKISLK